eukprot:1159488-Pelagomonas_calceolata.AAC.3
MQAFDSSVTSAPFEFPGPPLTIETPGSGSARAPDAVGLPAAQRPAPWCWGCAGRAAARVGTAGFQTRPPASTPAAVAAAAASAAAGECARACRSPGPPGSSAVPGSQCSVGDFVRWSYFPMAVAGGNLLISDYPGSSPPRRGWHTSSTSLVHAWTKAVRLNWANAVNARGPDNVGAL